MPDPPPFAKRVPQQPRHTHGEAQPMLRYAELHCRTNFSFLEGASHPDELVNTAVELGYEALAITDRHSLAGVVRAYAAARQSNLKLLVGAEVAPVDGPSMVLLARDRAGYGRLARLLTIGRRRVEKGDCQLFWDDIATHHEGLVALALPMREAAASSTDDGHLLKESLHSGNASDLRCPDVGLGHLTGARADNHQLLAMRDIFGDRGYLLAELHYGSRDAARLAELQRLSASVGLPLVASGDVHYHAPHRMVLQHVLTAIRHGTSVAELGARCLPNAERHLRTLEDLQVVFAEAPELLARTAEVAAQCTFSLAELRYEYPREVAPAGESPMDYLRRLTWQGAHQRYGPSVPERVQKMLTHELQLIEDLGYEAFFLTVYDAVQFANSRGILCQGRGSAANSAVCFCLGVTAVDPHRYELLFERFISRERDEAPDIDVDFEHERREEVLQYLYKKYGRERAGLAATVITYRPRSAIRDVGKALGLSLDRVDALAKNYDYRGERTLLPHRCTQSGVDPESRIGRQLLYCVNAVLGFPRHLSQHVGGMVITEGPLCELVPIENAAMPNRTVIQWDKDDLETLGMLKVDCLALGMLTAVRKCFDLLTGATGRRLTIATIPPEDPQVYDMICQADTVGVFQIESRAQMSMLPRLKPRTFYDLVIEVAIVRPGPIQGNMVHPYLRRRDGEEPVEYPSQEVERVLRRTLGVPLFQEQAMQLAVVAAGFSPGEADQLRRAMGGWRTAGVIDQYRQRLIEGMLARGYDEDFAGRLFDQIRGFGEYGFPESHAASFAILVYVSCWLKFHYPAAFTAAMINSQPLGFYQPAQLIRDAEQHGVEVLPIDVNHSLWDCTLEPTETQTMAIRLGLRMVRGLRATEGQQLLEARQTWFTSAEDLSKRARLGRDALAKLAAADALQSLRLNRREALWHALGQPSRGEALPLFAEDDTPPTPALPQHAVREEVYADYAATGLSLRTHPIAFHRTELAKLDVTTASTLGEVSHGRGVTVAGLVLMRQRPGTAKGITFVTLEDETGSTNLIIHRQVWRKFELVARRSQALIVRGRLERKGIVIHVIARTIHDLETRLGGLRHQSRDFR